MDGSGFSCVLELEAAEFATVTFLENCKLEFQFSRKVWQSSPFLAVNVKTLTHDERSPHAPVLHADHKCGDGTAADADAEEKPAAVFHGIGLFIGERDRLFQG